MAKYLRNVDATMLSMVALALGTAGGLAVVGEVQSPLATAAFLGGNPYALRDQAINQWSTYIFVGVALLGAIVQLYALVAPVPQERLHTTSTYVAVAGVCVVAVIVFASVAPGISRYISHLAVTADLIENQRDVFSMAEQLVRNDGLEDRVVGKLDAETERLTRESGRKGADRLLAQMEDLFGVRKRGTSQERLEQLRPIFQR
jgi:hypothetical protein